MSRTRLLIAIAAVLSFGFVSIPIRASVVPIGAFSGTYTETWESFPENLSHETFLSNPTSIMQGAATISNSTMTIYDTDFSNCALGTSGYSGASDGVKGMCVTDGPGYSDTVTITFNTPVIDFGAYWAAATSPAQGNPALISLSFFDVSNQLIDTEAFSYSRSSNVDGLLEWHGWSSTVPLKRITYSEDRVAIDGLQANPVPEPATVGLFCLAGMFLLRRRR